MNIMKPVLAGMALAIAATVTFSMADTAFAKSKKHHEAGTTQANPDETTRPSETSVVIEKICLAGNCLRRLCCSTR